MSEGAPLGPGVRQTLLNAKCARIIQCMAEMYGLTVERAMDIFYSSVTSTLINEGVADLHCRSDRYCAEEVWLEYN